MSTKGTALRISRRAAMALLGAGLPTLARATSSLSFDDITRFVFVPSTEQPAVTVVDGGTNQIAGALSLGIVPRQVLISRDEAKLIATDGVGFGFVTLDLPGSRLARITLPHVADRLVLGVSGWVLAAADTAGGKITLFDLRSGSIMHTIAGLPKLRDLMFVDQDGYLFVAAEDWTNIAVFDVNTGQLTQRIQPFRSQRRGITALARTPDGRSILVCPEGNYPPGIIDVESGKAVGELGQTAATDGVAPSGTGAFLFVPDNEDATLNVFHGDKLSSATALSAATGMGAVYSAWLDSVAFVACAPRRQLLIYDLDKLRPAGSLDLAGVPGQGGVTADSTRLYVPLTAPAGLAIIDGQTRRVVATLPMPATPLAAVVPGGWGLCH